MGGLVLLSLVLVTLSFRESDDGPVASAQEGAAAALRPFQVAADRIAEPFRDAYGWVDGLFDARSDAERRQGERDAASAGGPGALAARENVRLRELLAYLDGPRFPEGYRGLATGVISRPAGTYAQSIVIAAGRERRPRRRRPGRDAGRAGRDGEPRRLADGARDAPDRRPERRLGDDLGTDAAGVVRTGHGPRAPLRLDRVAKEAVVRVGDTVVTAGWRSQRLASIYPKGIQIGRVTSVGRTDTDPYTQVQVTPFADLGSLEAVLVLLPRERGGR